MKKGGALRYIITAIPMILAGYFFVGFSIVPIIQIIFFHNPTVGGLFVIPIGFIIILPIFIFTIIFFKKINKRDDN